MEYNKERLNKDRAYYKKIAKEYITPRYLDLKDLNGEVWKPINGFPGYSVSNKGRVRSDARLVSNGTGYHKSKPMILKPNVLAKGYFQVELKRNALRVPLLVHRLVANAFLPNLKIYDQINHINGIKADNRVENLEWCNNSMNQLHAWRIGLQVVSGKAGKPKRKIVQYSKEGKVIKVWDSIAECAHAFGDKSTGNLQKVLHHLAHYNTYHGYKFEYYGKVQ